MNSNQIPCFIVDESENDWAQYIPSGGIQWSRNDIDSNNSNRSQITGKMYRKRIATKRKLSVSMRDMETAKVAQLAKEIAPETIKVTYLDPMDGERTTREFYGSELNSATNYWDGERVWWSGITFSLVEV